MEPLYVARIHIYGPSGFEVIPGYFEQSKSAAYASTHNRVYSNIDYALLVNCIAEWINISKEQFVFPVDAFQGK